MKPVRPEFVPDPSLSRSEMESLQRDIAAAATFEDDVAFDPARIDAASETASGQTRLTDERIEDVPTVAGVDQAFIDDGDRAVSAVVVFEDGEVVERAHAVEPTEIPYVPGLLSFREGGAILEAFAELDADVDLAFVDGSGRIHFRQAGLATHIGVTLDVPTVGVAKRLLCGRPAESIPDDGLSEGERVPIEADDDVTAPDGTVIGHALQTRQYEGSGRHVNPLYVSPGHRVSARTTADVVAAATADYKLPEPTRRADSYAEELKSSVR